MDMNKFFIAFTCKLLNKELSSAHKGESKTVSWYFALYIYIYMIHDMIWYMILYQTTVKMRMVSQRQQI